MSDTKLRRTIRSMIRSVLLEQDQKPDAEKPKETQKPDAEKPKPKKKKKKGAAPGTIGIATGAVGAGRFKAFVGEAKARAEKDPEGLMKDLGVKQGGTDLDGVLSVINAAIHSNTTMGEAYSGAQPLQEQTPEGKMIKVIGIEPSGINTRDAIKFLSHTLSGAKNAGILSLTAGIEINQGRNASIVVYVI